MKNNTLNSLTTLGAQNFGFLIETNTRITTREFAERIRNYSSAPESAEIAQAFYNISGILRRDQFGQKYYPESDNNRSEIVLRDLGWVAEQVGEGAQSRFKIVRKDAQVDGSRRELPGLYDFDYQAYDEAVNTLKLRLRTYKAEMPHDPHVAAVFELMRQVVEAPGAMLQHYKSDFYEHDKNALHAFAGQGKFIWVVRNSSTQLAPVGISDASSSFVKAAMNSGGGAAYEVYVIDGDKLTIKQIHHEQALDILKHRDYETSGESVTRDGALLATVSVEMRSGYSEAPVGVVHVQPAKDANLSVRDLIALREISHRKVTEKSGSLFTPTQEIAFGADRKPISELIDLARGFDEVSQSRFYGTIKCEKNDAQILESLGVELGIYDEKQKAYTVAVPVSSIADLEPYHGSFVVDITSLPFSVKPDNALNSIISPDLMDPLDLSAYGAYLRYAMDCNERADPACSSTSYEADWLSDEMEAVEAARATQRAAKQVSRLESTPSALELS